MRTPASAQTIELLCDGDLAATANARLRALHGRWWRRWGGELPRAQHLVHQDGAVTGRIALPVPAAKGWAWWG